MSESAITRVLDREATQNETGPDARTSGPAEQRLLNEIRRYERELRTEASAIAKQENADVVSERDVKLAVERLRHSHAERSVAITTTFGGVFLGLGLSIVMQLLKAPLTTTETIAGLGACLLAGALLTPLTVCR